jgi:hypothetical protein
VVRATNIVSASLDRRLMPAAIRDLLVRSEGTWLLRDEAPPGLRAPPVLGGPVKHAFLGPFLFVRAGTPPGPDTAARFGEAVLDWQRYAKAPPRMGEEARMSASDLTACHVFLFGEPESSPWIRQVLAASPVTVTGAVYAVGSRTFPRQGNGLIVVRPSPWNPARLAVVQCGRRWGEGLAENHKYDLLPDYIVYSSARDWDGSDRALCAGFFAPDWSIDAARQSLATAP